MGRGSGTARDVLLSGKRVGDRRSVEFSDTEEYLINSVKKADAILSNLVKDDKIVGKELEKINSAKKCLEPVLSIKPGAKDIELKVKEAIESTAETLFAITYPDHGETQAVGVELLDIIQPDDFFRPVVQEKVVTKTFRMIDVEIEGVPAFKASAGDLCALGEGSEIFLDDFNSEWVNKMYSLDLIEEPDYGRDTYGEYVATIKLSRWYQENKIYIRKALYEELDHG